LFQSCIHFLACNIWMWQVAQVVFPLHKALLKFVLQLHWTLQTFLLQILKNVLWCLSVVCLPLTNPVGKPSSL
jgi:hypothetical protein